MVIIKMEGSKSQNNVFVLMDIAREVSYDNILGILVLLLILRITKRLILSSCAGGGNMTLMHTYHTYKLYGSSMMGILN